MISATATLLQIGILCLSLRMQYSDQLSLSLRDFSTWGGEKTKVANYSSFVAFREAIYFIWERRRGVSVNNNITNIYSVRPRTAQSSGSGKAK
jgi:hypothetical protein